MADQPIVVEKAVCKVTVKKDRLQCLEEWLTVDGEAWAYLHITREEDQFDEKGKLQSSRFTWHLNDPHSQEGIEGGEKSSLKEIAPSLPEQKRAAILKAFAMNNVSMMQYKLLKMFLPGYEIKEAKEKEVEEEAEKDKK